MPRSSLPRPAKIADVARLSGVSVATVSRTLANPEIVTAVTRERVMRAVQETGYTPNAAARNLRVRKAMMVLVVVPDIANPFFSEVLRGIDSSIAAAGYSLIIGNLGNDSAKEAAFVELARSGQVDGVLLLCGHVLRGRSGTLEDTNLPIVAVCEVIPDATFPHVEIDNRLAARHAVQYLIDLGHRHIAYLSGPASNILDVERRQGYRAALAAAGFSADPAFEIEGDFTFRAGREAAAAVLSFPEETRPTALFSANDEMAIGFLKAIQAAGLRVPEDFSVVGFDAIDYSEHCMPTLTTVLQPRREIGEAAGLLLLDMMADGSRRPASITLDASLVVRNSTANLA